MGASKVLEIYERLGSNGAGHVDARLVLNHEQRDKGRLRAVSAEGHEIHLFLERGKPLQVGEYLRSQCGKTVVVEGAIEPVVTALCDDWLMFSRACYHLGNRHVKMQIGPRWLRIAPDHVLEELLQLLGLQLRHDEAVFIPECGAYAHGHHHH
jgi:urease accessory protein